MTIGDDNRLDVFLHKCLWKILRIGQCGYQMMRYRERQELESGMKTDRPHFTDEARPGPAHGTDFGTRWTEK